LAFWTDFIKMRPMPPVIRASGGRCDITRCVSGRARGVVHLMRGRPKTMQAAGLEKPFATGALDADRLRAVVLVRIASSGRGVTKAEVGDDLGPLIAHRLPSARWRALLDGEIDALAAAGLITATGARIEASAAGIARAAIFLGLKGSRPRSWDDVLNVRLVAKALGLEREAGKRLAALATPDGLRAAIVQRAFGLKIKGVATPSRLRSGLAAVALARAFGNQFKAELAGKLAFPAKAGRLLAAQLARKPRDFGTDSRLVAALAAEHVGATQTSLAALRVAVLRRYLDRAEKRAPAPRRPAAKAPMPRPRLVEPATPPLPAMPLMGRPDPAGFAQEVRRQAVGRAQGWPGNRKAYISHVWHTLRESRPEWGLSEIEFKCMLTEAHRAGSLALANADLKDNSCIKDLQDSAVVYKNAVFHFIRVDG
jgi:hypothetical protein